MLQTIKRWFSSDAGAGWGGVETWARERGFAFRRSRESDGFVVEGGTGPGGQPVWRLEWGPSQRSYIGGGELRLRAEIGGELQLLVLSRGLMEAMEKAVFESYTEDLQTRIDTTTPEEMRWLVLLPKLPSSELKGLREGFGVVGSAPKWASMWIEGALTDALVAARAGWLGGRELALIVQRGRLTMRLALDVPRAAELDAALALFDVARRQARHASQSWIDNGAASTMPSLFNPGEGPPGR